MWKAKFCNAALILELLGVILSTTLENTFSYKLIKDSLKNLVLSEKLHFEGPVYLYHGMADNDVSYEISINITKKIVGTQNVNLLLEKEAGHRLSDAKQLKKIINIIETVKNQD